MATQPASGAADGRNHVAIFGAGPGGLSAALELVERGFEVDLYEKGSFLGGKSRSETVVGSGTGGRKDLPIENGPHAYWGTYQHWNDTLARVPAEGGDGTVLDNLAVAGKEVRHAFDGGRSRIFDRHRVEFAKEVLSRLLTWELPRLICKIVALATSGLARQHGQLEDITLTQYTGPLSRKSFELLATLVSQVKVDPDWVSARETARNLHIFSGHFGAKGLGQGAHSLVGITRGPADEAIFAPFGRHLEKLGVRIHLRNELVALTSLDGLVTGAQVRDASCVARRVTADWYILAVPQDVAPKVLTPQLVKADPLLGRLDRLGEQWLGAANVFLKGPRLPNAFCLGPWQLVAVDYSAAVPDFGEQYGDGNAKQWMSIDLQTWDCPGLLYGKTAKECTKEEFFEEILAHLANSYPSSWGKLNRDNIIRWDVSRLLRYEPGRPVINDEPLFGAIAGAWSGQPRAVTAVDNLFIGATYARTTGGIDSMDCACEAARRSVNAILDRTQTNGRRAFVDSYDTAGLLKKLWDYDDRRYRKGLPNRFDVIRPFRGRPSEQPDESWRELL
ncbi:NAD(P)-binding protein [Mycobacterium marseillense]|uniref:NAD(P)-binding protein n=1 Tax=Mycobacterium marseillense TaxID=701042 RepID=UPI0011A7CAB5|nr:NAD(P)-binding protein [Mycobacterium marseillense]MDM3975562.1 NAD(P)-binding protein [Mycobacterium marseillense]